MKDKPAGTSLGCVVVVASSPDDGARILRLLQQANYQTVLVECETLASRPVSLPGPTASTPPCATLVCHRQSMGVPIPRLPDHSPGHRLIVLSDCRSESAVVQTLEAGAHHFFSIDEPETVLQARLEAGIRRHFLSAQRLEIEPFAFDLQRRLVMHLGKPIDLSPKEYEFAYYLFSQRGRIVTNDELMTSVWSLPKSMDTRRIDTAACRVRKKMLNATGSGWHLRRLRNTGYELFSEKTVLPAV